MNALTGFALTLTVFIVTLAIGLTITSQLSDNLDEGSVEKNATDEMIEATAEIPGWIPIIIIAVIGSLVLLLLFKAFGGLMTG